MTTSFLTLLSRTCGEFYGLLTRSSSGLLVEFLLMPCISGVQVLGFRVCSVSFLVILSLFDMCCSYATYQLVFPCWVLELVASCAAAFVFPNCVWCCHLLVRMWGALCRSRGDETIIKSIMVLTSPLGGCMLSARQTKQTEATIRQ